MENIKLLHVKLPLFMEAHDSLAGLSATFKIILERAHLRVHFTESVDVTILEIDLYEMKDEPIKNYIETWQSGICHPLSGTATYHGLIEKGELKFKQENHSATIYYGEFTPGGDLVKMTVFTGLIPRKLIDKNKDGLVIRTIQFAGTVVDEPIETDKVIEEMKSIISNIKKFEASPSFNVDYDSVNTYDPLYHPLPKSKFTEE